MLGLIMVKKVIRSDQTSGTIRLSREAWLNLDPSLTRISGDMKTKLPQSTLLVLDAKTVFVCTLLD